MRESQLEDGYRIKEGVAVMDCLSFLVAQQKWETVHYRGKPFYIKVLG